jgi:hypothetical protein
MFEEFILGLPVISETEDIHSNLNQVPYATGCETTQQRCVLEEMNDADDAFQLNAEHEQAEEADEVQVQVLQDKTEVFPSRRRWPVALLDTSLLRRSARLEDINKGFNPNGGSDNADSATTASSAQSSSRHKESKKKGKAPMLDGPAYSGHNIPGSSPAPHLSLANVQSIGTGFCKMQMQPGAVSGEVLLAPINEDIDNYLCLARLDVSLLIILVVTFDSLAAPLFSSSTVLSG